MGLVGFEFLKRSPRVRGFFLVCDWVVGLLGGVLAGIFGGSRGKNAARDHPQTPLERRDFSNRGLGYFQILNDDYRIMRLIVNVERLQYLWEVLGRSGGV
jgi:hypothetical protein